MATKIMSLHSQIGTTYFRVQNTLLYQKNYISYFLQTLSTEWHIGLLFNSTSRSISWVNLIGLSHIPLTNQNGYCILQVPMKIIYKWNVKSCKRGMRSTRLGGQVLTVDCFTGSKNVLKTASGWQLDFSKFVMLNNVIVYCGVNHNN